MKESLDARKLAHDLKGLDLGPLCDAATCPFYATSFCIGKATGCAPALVAKHPLCTQACQASQKINEMNASRDSLASFGLAPYDS